MHFSSSPKKILSFTEGVGGLNHFCSSKVMAEKGSVHHKHLLHTAYCKALSVHRKRPLFL